MAGSFLFSYCHNENCCFEGIYMGKKKHKKKNMKKREIKKMQVEDSQEMLSADVEKCGVENLVDDAEKEQRRTARLGAVIPIVAVIGTLCTFLFEMTVSSLNVWPKQGIMYWYLHVLFSFALSTVVIIFLDIVLYVINDLKRYNTLDRYCKQYDQKSDDQYMHLLNDFKIYTIMLICVFILSIPLFASYQKGSQKWVEILVFCLCVFAGVVFVVQWVKYRSKGEIKKILLIVVKTIGKGMLVAIFCYITSAIFVLNNKATISVSYNAEGIVEVCNTSAEGYKGLDIEIWNMDEGTIYTESIKEEKLLFAREDTYINNEVDGKKVSEGILINGECLHWKYLFDLKKVINESGEYYVSITVHQDNKSANLINSLSVDVENKEYIFAKDSMDKDY